MSVIRFRLMIAACLMLLGGCQTVGNTYDRWFGKSRESRKPAELVAIQPTAAAKLLWQGSVGGAERDMFFPDVSGKVVYATGAAGQITGFDVSSGRQVARIEAGQRISGGVGSSGAMVLVGTAKGEVLALDSNGKSLWKARLSGEVLSPPVMQDGVVVARAGDGSIFGLDATNGRRKWIYQRSTPALSLRNHAGIVVERGAVFSGFAGGRLVAIALATGNVGWEAVVALPRGTTELERVADITSLPVIDQRQVCAVAFQGRVACFDLLRGTTLWARDMSSVAGMAADARYLYVTDDKDALIALDKNTGASIWKQDKLTGRGVSGPLAFGRYVVVGDYQGYVHVLSREDGSFAARIATDGSAIGAAPAALTPDSFVVQTRNGGIFAITVQ
ncbi:MAG: outer membrane protein assembly factor BamB [Burkholderiales bacterium]|nr:outer membrane protein assembly factor BamB [Burkholderiales bacterium]